jgi:hypothetical protein
MAEIRNHLDTCSRCRENVEQIESTSIWSSGRLETLALRSDTVPGTSQALARLENEINRQSSWKERLEIMFGSINRRWRPALIAFAVLTIISVAFAFEPVRATAEDLLSIFRVRQFAAVPIGPEEQQALSEISELLEQNLFFSEPIMSIEPEITLVDTVAQASDIVGFDVHTPTFMPSGFTLDTIETYSKSAGQMEIDIEQARSVFELLELDPALLPDSLGEKPLGLEVPPNVVQTWQYKNKTGLTYIQGPSPSLDFPEDVDTVALGTVALQLFGMSERDAERMSKSIDWTNTLVVPIPTNIVSFREITVDGTDGLLISGKADDNGSHSAVMWQKGDIINFIQGNVLMDTIVEIAESVQ